MLKHLMMAALLAAAGLAQAADDAAGKRLESLLAGMNTWSTRFEQTVEAETKSTSKPVLGQFSLQRPGKFRWETTAPYQQLLVADGAALWTYDKDLEQISVQDLDTGIGATPAALLSSGQATLARDFKVSLIAGGEPGSERFALLPTSASSLYELIELGFTAGQLRQMTVMNSLKKRTVLRFHDVKAGEKLDSAQFQFTPPEGVDLIDSRKRR